MGRRAVVVAVGFSFRQLVSAPLLVLGAFRDEEVSGDETRRELLARARGNGDVVALTGLAAADVDRLMGAVAGVRPPAGLAGEVFRRTGGNPFFVRELTQLLVSRGGLGDQPPGRWHPRRGSAGRDPTVGSAAAAVRVDLDGGCGRGAGDGQRPSGPGYGCGVTTRWPSSWTGPSEREFWEPFRDVRVLPLRARPVPGGHLRRARYDVRAGLHLRSRGRYRFPGRGLGRTRC